jgi:hypothetical protein
MDVRVIGDANGGRLCASTRLDTIALAGARRGTAPCSPSPRCLAHCAREPWQRPLELRRPKRYRCPHGWIALSVPGGPTTTPLEGGTSLLAGARNAAVCCRTWQIGQSCPERRPGTLSSAPSCLPRGKHSDDEPHSSAARANAQDDPAAIRGIGATDKLSCVKSARTAPAKPSGRSSVFGHGLHRRTARLHNRRRRSFTIRLGSIGKKPAA